MTTLSEDADLITEEKDKTMAETNRGGSVYPRTLSTSVEGGATPGYRTDYNTTPGMALRDYFAGQYLMGRVASPTFDGWFTRADSAEAWEAANVMINTRDGAINKTPLRCLFPECDSFGKPVSEEHFCTTQTNREA